MKPNNAKLAERIEDVRILTREISMAVSNVEKWMNAIYNISFAMRDHRLRDEMITAISKLELQDRQEELNVKK